MNRSIAKVVNIEPSRCLPLSCSSCVRLFLVLTDAHEEWQPSWCPYCGEGFDEVVTTDDNGNWVMP